MATILPFPLLRRRGYVQRQALRMARETPRGAENWLAYIIEINRQAMIRRGIPTDLSEAELHDLEAAIRAQVVRIVMRGGGAA
jgi:hypothetical protein